MSKCPNPICFAPRTTCAEGHLRLQECPFLKSEVTGGGDTPAPDEGAGTGFPWTGNSLGLDDLHLVSRIRKPEIIGLIGPHSSGKTSILAVTYLLVFNGHGLGGRGFARSLTLHTWEQISSYFKFQGHDVPSFPPHTPSGAARAPGLLHLGMRDGSRVDDFVITDPPGEWFEKWAVNADDPEAEGARWIAKNSSRFAFLLDSDRLAGKDEPAKYKVYDLAARLASERSGREVAIVWAKADKEVDPARRGEVEGVLDELLPGAEHFSMSVAAAENIERDFQRFWTWMFSPRTAAAPRPVIVLRPRSEDQFLRYRG